MRSVNDRPIPIHLAMLKLITTHFHRGNLSDYLTVLVGIIINLAIVSIPLLWKAYDAQLRPFSPTIVSFYALIVTFTALETSASLFVKNALISTCEKPIASYFSGLAVLIVFWLSLHQNLYTLVSSLWLIIPSIVITILGILIRCYSILSLKYYFVSHIGLVNNHQLITTGIYSVLRHPSESGMILICFGVSLLLTSMVGIVITLVIVVPLSLYRISMEDNMLARTFGESFLLYKSHVPAIIPSIKHFKVS